MPNHGDARNALLVINYGQDRFGLYVNAGMRFGPGDFWGVKNDDLSDEYTNVWARGRRLFAVEISHWSGVHARPSDMALLECLEIRATYFVLPHHTLEADARGGFYTSPCTVDADLPGLDKFEIADANVRRDIRSCRDDGDS